MSSYFVLAHKEARWRAAQACMEAPDGYVVTIKPPGRTGEQNAKFHALVGDIAKSGLQWAGKPRTPAEWKVLLVSAHAMATKEGADIVPGLEGEFVNLRESTALMSKARSSSLVEYTVAFAVQNGVEIGAF